jgi:hypothetical protein
MLSELDKNKNENYFKKENITQDSKCSRTTSYNDRAKLKLISCGV